MSEPLNIKNRRPIASRDSALAKHFASWLVAINVSPNMISIFSIVFAAISGACLLGSSFVEDSLRVALLLFAIVGCQLRLVCNLFDGMVAVEGGRAAKDGAFWNEFPDRVADLLIFAGAGYAAGTPALGFAAAALAIFTAYVRELGRACGAPSDYSGPMAKQHRMWLLCLACFASFFNDLYLLIGLGLIAIGSIITIFRRAVNLIQFLRVR